MKNRPKKIEMVLPRGQGQNNPVIRVEESATRCCHSGLKRGLKNLINEE